MSILKFDDGQDRCRSIVDFPKGLSCAQLEMSPLARKQTFMMKILVWAWDKRNKLKFFKKSYIPGSPGPQSKKSFLDLFFDRKELTKIFFALVSLSTKKYFRKKSSKKYAFPRKKSDFFVFLWTNFICHLLNLSPPWGYVRFGSDFF